MKRAILSVVALALLVSGFALAELGKLYVKVDKENLRLEPNGKIIAKVVKATEMGVIETKGGWAKVRITGWIWRESTTDRLSEVPVKPVKETVILSGVDASGVLVVPVINLWSIPGSMMEGASVVGRVKSGARGSYQERILLHHRPLVV